ncbi:DUF1761 domain-containing protein [Fodinicola acaciae]|uniref:DUF1761 domain-containing protein n=1 Tax=Fodinicola acaciae TaxID=2681555 RepID=UPI0013CFF51F|nr:DUF1761 domain-containing protein [Fodinicola acaciae]
MTLQQLAGPVRINYLAAGVAALVTLVCSAVYYIALGGVWASLRGLDPGSASPPGAGEIAGQYVRNLIVALALAYLLRWAGATTVPAALRVAMVVWLGFQAMAIAGSVLHEHYPLGLYFLHTGDALMTTLIMAVILGNWRRTARSDPSVPSC